MLNEFRESFHVTGCNALSRVTLVAIPLHSNCPRWSNERYGDSVFPGDDRAAVLRMSNSPAFAMRPYTARDFTGILVPLEGENAFANLRGGNRSDVLARPDACTG